jgi:hypothetical protein
MTDLALPPPLAARFYPYCSPSDFILFLFLFFIAALRLPSPQPARGLPAPGAYEEAELHVCGCLSLCSSLGLCVYVLRYPVPVDRFSHGRLGGNCEQTNRTGGGVRRGVLARRYPVLALPVSVLQLQTHICTYQAESTVSVDVSTCQCVHAWKCLVCARYL